MTSPFDKYSQELLEIRRRAGELVSGLTSDQLCQRPDPAKWSIAECLAHLNLAAEAVQPKIAAAIEQGKKDKRFANVPASLGFWGVALTWWAEPPPKVRIPAPKSIAPKVAVSDGLQVVADFMRLQDEWARLLREAEGLDQKKIKVAGLFPGLPALRLSAPIPWMLAHERRHLWQAENVRRQMQAGMAVSRGFYETAGCVNINLVLLLLLISFHSGFCCWCWFAFFLLNRSSIHLGLLYALC